MAIKDLPKSKQAAFWTLAVLGGLLAFVYLSGDSAVEENLNTFLLTEAALLVPAYLLYRESEKPKQAVVVATTAAPMQSISYERPVQAAPRPAPAPPRWAPHARGPNGLCTMCAPGDCPEYREALAKLSAAARQQQAVHAHKTVPAQPAQQQAPSMNALDGAGCGNCYDWGRCYGSKEEAKAARMPFDSSKPFICAHYVPDTGKRVDVGKKPGKPGK